MHRAADEGSQDEEQERAASGHARDADPEDAVDRVDARLRHRAAHPDAVRGRADDRRGIAVSGAAADGRQGMGVRRVEYLGQQPASSLLQAHDRREEAARYRGIAILPDVRRDHARDEDDVGSDYRGCRGFCAPTSAVFSSGISSIGTWTRSCAFTKT